MNKKYFVLMLLLLALSSQFSLAATVDGINQNTRGELVNTKRLIHFIMIRMNKH